MESVGGGGPSPLGCVYSCHSRVSLYKCGGYLIGSNGGKIPEHVTFERGLERIVETKEDSNNYHRLSLTFYLTFPLMCEIPSYGTTQ